MDIYAWIDVILIFLSGFITGYYTIPKGLELIKNIREDRKKRNETE